MNHKDPEAAPPIIVHIVYSGLGGIASVFFSLVESSQNDIFKHVVAFYGIEPVKEDYIEHCEALGIEYFYFQRKPKFDLDVNRKVFNWLHTIKPHAIIVNLPRALPATTNYRRENPQSIVVGVEHHPNAQKRVIDWWDSINFSWKCSSVIYLTDTYLAEVKNKIGWLFNHKKATVIPNGINTDKFCPSKKERQDHQLRLGICARLTSTKDITTLIKAFSVLCKSKDNPQLALTIAGEGPEKQNLIDEITKLDIGEKVALEGFLAENQLIEWFQNLDIYVHTSLSETMSTSIMQALSCGVPCIVSDLPGIQELVPTSAGCTFPVSNVATLSEKLQSLIIDEKRRNTMKIMARTHAVESLSQSLTWSRYRVLLDDGHDT